MAAATYVPPSGVPELTVFTDLEIWYDAADTATITDSSGDVTAWDDKSGNGRHLGNVTGTPRTGDDTINGLNVVAFGGGEGLRHTPSTKIGQTALTAFIVLERTGTVTTQAAPLLLTSTSVQSTGAPYDRWSSASENRFRLATTNHSSGWHSLHGSQPPELYRITLDYGTTLSEHINGSLINSITPGSPSTANQQILVGRRGDGGTSFPGNVAEILAYNRILSGGEITSVEAYLTAKWGL